MTNYELTITTLIKFVQPIYSSDNVFACLIFRNTFSQYFVVGFNHKTLLVLIFDNSLYIYTSFNGCINHFGIIFKRLIDFIVRDETF